MLGTDGSRAIVAGTLTAASAVRTTRGRDGLDTTGRALDILAARVMVSGTHVGIFLSNEGGVVLDVTIEGTASQN